MRRTPSPSRPSRPHIKPSGMEEGTTPKSLQRSKRGRRGKSAPRQRRAASLAPLPSSISGHFGAELRRFVLLQHYHGQVTVEWLTMQLRAIGFSISKRQVMRLLIDRQVSFLTVSRDVLRAGL
jgi:hypothetical protein